MEKHCYEPIVKVESGWRIDYNPCRHYNTLYITIDTKEILFNGVAYNRFNIQDINYQNGTIYINVGNRLLSCKLPNASRECAGLMSPLDKQQLDYIFQLLENGIDSINFSKNVSWGINLDQNNDKLILVFVNPITSFNDLLNIGEVEKLVSALVLKPITTLSELKNLGDNDDCFISANLLKELIEYNDLKDTPEETYLITLFIDGQQINQQNIVSGGNYNYTYNRLLNGYELINNSSYGVSINGSNITLNNIQQHSEIRLTSRAILYTITESGYDSITWNKTGYNNNEYTVNNEFEITYILLNPSLYSESNVISNKGTVSNNGNSYTITIPQGTIGNITILLSAIKRGLASIPTPPTAMPNLIYNNSEKTLVTLVSANNGNIWYAVTEEGITTAPSKEDSNSWQSTIPKRINAGTYKVWYYAKGNSGYDDSDINYVEVTISKANLSSLSVSMDGWTVGLNASEPLISGNIGGGTVTYKYKLSTASDSTYSTIKPSTAGTYTVQAIVEATENYNGKSVTSNFTINNPAITYYWYVGHTDPSTMNSIIPLPSNSESEGAGWRTIGTSLPTYSKTNPLWDGTIISTAESKSTQYVALPSNQIKSHEGINEGDVTSDAWTINSTKKTLNGVNYTIWTSINTKKSFADILY